MELEKPLVLNHRDILFTILNLLDEETIVNASVVCKFWNQVCKEEALWTGERGASKESKVAKRNERIQKRIANEKRAKEINRDLIHILSIHTPIHDIVCVVLFILSIILLSLRVEDVISTRYLYLFIPGFFACSMWMVKGISGIFLYNNQKRLSNSYDVTSLFSSEGVLHKGTYPILHSIFFAFFFFIVFVIIVVLVVQIEIETVPKWSVFVPLIVFFVFIASASVTNCGNLPLCYDKKTSADFIILSTLTLITSILFAIYFVLCLLKVGAFIDIKWSVVHVPIWIQVTTLNFSLMEAYIGIWHSHELLQFCQTGFELPFFSYHLVQKRKEDGPFLVLIVWSLAGAPWLLFHILLVVRLEITEKVKVWAILIPLELQLLACLVMACLATRSLSNTPLGQLWFYDVYSVYTLTRLERDPELEKSIYCWKGVFRINMALKRADDVKNLRLPGNRKRSK